MLLFNNSVLRQRTNVIHIDLRALLNVRNVRLLTGRIRGTICACGTYSKAWVVLRGTWNFTSELFKRLTLGLRDEESGEDTQKHEESENLHDVVQPWIWIVIGGALHFERTDEDLSDNRTNLAGAS